MNLTNFGIVRAIAHDVVRASQLSEHPPILSDTLVVLDQRGQDLVGTRLVETIASGSHCIDVAVETDGDGSAFDKLTKMIDCSDRAFVRLSQELAQALSRAQTAGPIKSGSAIFVQGTCAADADRCRFMAVIKADSDQALQKRVKGDNITLTFVNDMLLGESQRLVKIAILIEQPIPDDSDETVQRSPEHFRIKVFDHLLQQSSESQAAAYFYKTFLGCRQAHTAAVDTKLFFDLASELIDQLPIAPYEKVNLRGDLISHLRSNRGTLEARTFAKEVLPPKHQTAFVEKCKQAGFRHAITKDASLIKGKLRHQSLKFSSQITLFGSPEAIKESVRIVGDAGDGWTDVQIRGSLEYVK